MADKIDARGLSCPQPVVLTQQLIKTGETGFQVIVDTVVSMENVLRCVEKNKLSGSVAEDGGAFIITVSKK